MTDFAALVHDFLEEQHREHPVRASSLGLTEYDDRLDDLTAGAFERRAAARHSWLTRFAGVDPADLDFDQQIDRDLLIAGLHDEEIYDEWGIWQRSADTYLNPGMEGIFSLFLHRLRPDAELARAATARLRQIPANLEAGRANLRPELVSPLLLDRAIRQARAGAHYLRVLAPAQVEEERVGG